VSPNVTHSDTRFEFAKSPIPRARHLQRSLLVSPKVSPVEVGKGSGRPVRSPQNGFPELDYYLPFRSRRPSIPLSISVSAGLRESIMLPKDIGSPRLSPAGLVRGGGVRDIDGRFDCVTGGWRFEWEEVDEPGE